MMAAVLIRRATVAAGCSTTERVVTGTDQEATDG